MSIVSQKVDNLLFFIQGKREKGLHYKVHNVGRFKGSFFRIFEIIIFCFVAAICELVYGVATTHGLC